MQNQKFGQPVLIVLIAGILTGCAAGKEYTAKIFPQEKPVKESREVALRFLELDRLAGDDRDWVSTDIIMGRDTLNQTIALDNLSKTYPAKKDTSAIVKSPEGKSAVDPGVAKTKNPGEVREKRTRD